jgi:hypothetical protein
VSYSKGTRDFHLNRAIFIRRTDKHGSASLLSLDGFVSHPVPDIPKTVYRVRYLSQTRICLDDCHHMS